MPFARCAIRLAGISTLSIAAVLSGCGTIAQMVVGSVMSSHERSEDDSFCKRLCSSLKDQEYIVCHKDCVSDQARKRSESKKQLEDDMKAWQDAYRREQKNKVPK